MKFIGMRNIKTAISVLVCVLISYALKLEYPFYACIAAVISMQSSVADSFKAGKNRMLGTFLGALTGLIFALIAPGNVILIFLGILIVISLSNYFKWKQSVSIGCIVFLAIMTNLNGKTPFNYSVNRLLDTLIGIFVAVLVNYLVLPPKYLDRIVLQCNKLVDILVLLCGKKLCYNEKIDLPYIKKEMDILETCVTNYKKDVMITKKEHIEIDKINKVIEVCEKIFMHLEIIDSLNETALLNEDNKKNLKELFNFDISIVPGSNTDITVIYNYHVKNVVNELKFLVNEDLRKHKFFAN